MTEKTAKTYSGQSALQAYRSDLPRGGDEPTAHDADAIIVSTLLRQSLGAEPDTADRLRAEGIAIAKRSLGEAALANGCTYDDHPAESDIDVLRLLAQRTAQSGRLCLTQHLLESVAELAADPIDGGRILADRARSSRKQGRLDLAEAQAQELIRRSKRLKSSLLLALAHDVLAGVVQTRGNFVEFGVNLEAVVRHARKGGLKRILASGYGGLGIRAGMAGDYGEAVSHHWAAYHAAEGSAVIATHALVNLAQTLLLSGRPIEARKIGALVLQSNPPAHTALPALGGYAVASARLNDGDGVEWACNQVRQLSRRPYYIREVAGALIECAMALEELGRAAQAGVLRRRAESIALEFGFHDLTFTEALDAAIGAPERQAFVGEAARAVDEIARLEVPRIATDFEPAFA